MIGPDLDEAAQPQTSARTRRAHKPRPPLGLLEARIGHSFADQSLLTRALTHTSKAAGRGGSYQRLEFLGDRVLGLAVADRLYAAFPMPTRAISRAGSPPSCGGRPARSWPRPGMSDPT